jgi:hypothetical protein
MKDESQELARRSDQSPAQQLFESLANIDWQQIDTEKMKVMLDMQERMIKRQAEEAFNRAFAKMQPELPVIERDGSIIVKGKLRSRYATYEGIMAAVAEPLKTHGFAVNFNTQTGDTFALVTCKLRHEDGHSEPYEIRLPIERTDFRSAMQDVSATISFGKRTLLKLALNIVERGEETPQQLAFVTEEQLRDLQVLIDDSHADLARFLAYFGIEKLSNLSVKDYKEATAMLQMKIQQQQQQPPKPPEEASDK